MLFLLPAPAIAQAHTRCETHACVVRVADHKCSNTDPRYCALYIVEKKDIGEPEKVWMLEIPGCESKWNAEEPPNSSGSTGLYQFQMPTWEEVERESSYGDHSIYSARWQSFFADWLYKRDGDGREWSCTSILGLT
jgi:hypothetical protein